jgi:3-dehydroquinate dehydratase-1
MQTRPITVGGRPLGDGRAPATCAPLVGRTLAALEEEAAVVAAKRPDLLEWRVDFFAGIADSAQVLAAARAIHARADGIPLLFTRRSAREGGEAIPLDEPGVVALYREVCASGLFGLVDFEMENDPAHIAEVAAMAKEAGAGLVLSFHDFKRTPPVAELVARFGQAARLGADVAKVAVMPADAGDVLRLLEATLQAGRELSVPVISMSMGGWGTLTRLCGGVFGSALTFAVGRTASAPGQMPIEDVRAALAILRQGMGR